MIIKEPFGIHTSDYAWNNAEYTFVLDSDFCLAMGCTVIQ